MGARSCIWASGNLGESPKGVRRIPFDSMLSLEAPGRLVAGLVVPAVALMSVAGLLDSQLASRASVTVVPHSSRRGRFM